MSKKLTHLKSITNSRVFLFSNTLATRSDMIPCNANGEIAEGFSGDATAIDATQKRRKTKFLGNVTNGVLYPYTDFLAERDDMISIDTEEQWKSMKATGKAPEQVANVVAPVLDREPKEPVKPKAPETQKMPETPASAQGPGTFTLPVIDGMGAREAKTVLSEWAKMNFGAKINRKPKLEEVMKECQELVMKEMDKAAGQ